MSSVPENFGITRFVAVPLRVAYLSKLILNTELGSSYIGPDKNAVRAVSLTSAIIMMDHLAFDSLDNRGDLYFLGHVCANMRAPCVSLY